MIYIGNLIKMESLHTNPVIYTLSFSGVKVAMNELIGETISLSYLNEINCIRCGKKTKKSFGQGYCYPCFISAPETSPCILKPELCEAHLGISRDMEWSKEHCLTDHYVYLAITAGIKVGVTRCSQIPTRWIDQGAVKAIKFAKTPNRHLAGRIELILANYISDKTPWQKMLKNDIDLSIDLIDRKKNLHRHLTDDLSMFFLSDDDEILDINYPVDSYPQNVKSIDLDKTIDFSGLMTGIKGQYLLFADGSVINIRKYNGYKLSLSVL
jgi:hypothetical protein